MKTTNEKFNEIKQMTVEEEIAEFRMRLRNVKQRVERLENHVHEHDKDGKPCILGWTGAMEYDATKAVRDVPQERRDKFVRKFDTRTTLKTRGVTLFLTKKMIVVAGERLAEPKEVQETFPLRPEPK